MNIALIGSRCSGKTTVAKLLAKKLDKKLVSTDEEIMKKTKTTIVKLVRKYGWEKFREIESDAIEYISDFDECIFDTGSGIVMRNENIINLKKNGIIIFLTSDMKTVAARLRRKEEKIDFTKSKYIDKVKGALSEFEEKCKRAADYIIDTSNMTPEEACDLIVHYVQLELH